VTRENPGIEYKIEPLGTRHDRAAFSGGVPALDACLHRQAKQDLERNLSAVFILTSDCETVAGFYTLSAHSIQAAELPEVLGKKLSTPGNTSWTDGCKPIAARPATGRISSDARTGTGMAWFPAGGILGSLCRCQSGAARLLSEARFGPTAFAA
jgi:hypothetical protein